MYITAIVFGTALIDIIFKLKPIRKLFSVLSTILPVALIFVMRSMFAAYRGYWEFNMSHMLGLIVINQPVEEILFFFAVPFYYITIWELVKKLCGERK